jgi:hypothetical protein
MSTKEELIERIKVNQAAARDTVAELDQRFAVEDLLRENDIPIPPGSISLGVVLENRRYCVYTGDNVWPKSGPCVVAIRVNGGKLVALKPYVKGTHKYYLSMQQWGETYGAIVPVN